MLTNQEITTIITPIVKHHPISRVILFGSYARGNPSEDSDVDLIIDSDGKLNGFDFFGIAGRISKVMPIKTDVFELSEIKKPSSLYERIMTEGVLLYEA